jgi:molybdate transport system substrate-binding protein
VPVGIYTKDYLTKLGLWEKISSKVVPTENVRASLAAVESGNAQAGFVYRTDLLISHQVKAALEIPAAEGPKISYPVAVLKNSGNLDEAKQFLQFLKSPSSMKVFKKFGFITVESGP